jgi:hypothetical protein
MEFDGNTKKIHYSEAKRGWGIWKSWIGRYTTIIDDIWANDDCEERLYKQLMRSDSEMDGKTTAANRSSFKGYGL